MRTRLLLLATVLAVSASAIMSGCSSSKDSTSTQSSAAASSTTSTTVADRSDSEAVTTTAFTGGEGGYATFRIPAVVAAQDGTLLAFAEGRKSSAADDGDVDLVLKKSSDGGTTWGALQVVSEDGANFVGNPSPVVDKETGRVVVLATHKNGQDSELEILTATGQDTSRVWLLTSEDNGTSWASPQEITEQVKRPDWRWFTVGPGHAIQLSVGKNAGRLVAPANYSDPQTGAGNVALLSDDGGSTWRIGAEGNPDDANNPDECTSAEMPDGSIIFSSRNQNQAAPWHRLRTTSSDSGQSFAAPFAEQVGLVVPVVQGSLLWDGDPSDSNTTSAAGRLLFSAPSNQNDRVDLSIRSSTDAGVTWSAGTLIAAGPAGYSDLVELPGGLVGVLHEAGVSNSFERIDMTVLGSQKVPS